MTGIRVSTTPAGSEPRPRRRTAAAGRALAAAAGGLPVLTYPEPALDWLAWAALVPLLLVLARAPSAREAAIRGWFGGAGFIMAVHHWLLPNLLVFLPVVAGLVGLLWVPWAWLAWRLLRPPVPPGRAAAALALVPCGWLLIEVARSWERLGGPWGLLGASQWRVPAALDLAALGGVWLVSLAVVAANVALALLLLGRPRARLVAAAAGGCLVAAAAGWAAVWSAPAGPATVTLVAVQPGVTPGPAARLAAAEAITRNLPAGPAGPARPSTGAGPAAPAAPAAGRPGLVVWGESSVGYDLGSRPDVRRRLSALSARTGAPLLVNVDARRADRAGIYKSAVLVTPTGPAGRYDKMRLVPFGEYVPLRGAAGWLSRITEAAAEDRRRGDRLRVLDAGGLRVGPLVCFESAFPDMSRNLVRAGADLVVVQSATSTFQGSWAPEQHASLAALRAAETGRPVLHATLTGSTAGYDPSGRRIGAALGTDQRGALTVQVPLGDARTPYVRFGDWVPALAAAVLTGAGTLAGTLAAWRSTRNRRWPGWWPGRPARARPR